MKVAIAGFGAEGKSNYRYWSTGGHDVTIVDERTIPAIELPKDAKTIMGEGSFSRLNGFDLVVRTAGLAPNKITTDGTIWSATNEFFEKCPAAIVGVTGTKGKGTTCSLTASILRESGCKVHLVGNIGVPSLDVLRDIASDDIVVYELSSFQLWDAVRSPHVAVVVMIEPDHLNVHKDMSEYVAAKANIAAHQEKDDIVLYHPTNRYASKIAEKSVGKKARYGISADGQVYVAHGKFMHKNNEICGVDALQIPGEFNQQNACAAMSAVLALDGGTDYMEAGLRNFKGLPHRLKYIRSVDGVSYYDDSIATTPGSAIAALRTFGTRSVIILGGSDKGASYDEVVKECKKQAARVIAVGQTGKIIAKLCREHGISVRRVEGSMPIVVQEAKRIAQSGDAVVLSPASASFDQYKSYADRGEKFIAAVEELV